MRFFVFDRDVCEYARLNGAVDVEDDPDVVESVEYFHEWWEKTQPTYLEHQVMVWNTVEGVCGTLDLLLGIDDAACIIDLKRTHIEEQT